MKPPEVELGPFAALYNEWTGSWPEPRDSALGQRLAESYRLVWAQGDSDERVHVAFYLLQRRDPGDAGLLLEGIQDLDFAVASFSSAAASVFRYLDKVDLGPTALDAHRAMALNHPALDLSREPRLRADDGWPDGRPFVQLYEKWMCDEFPRDAAIEKQLAASVQETWATGDAVDKAFVLNFLGCHRKEHVPTDLLRQGLASDDYRLARVALFEIDCALSDGHEMGSGIRELLEAHYERFPQSFTLVAGCLMEIEEWKRPDHSP